MRALDLANKKLVGKRRGVFSKRMRFFCIYDLSQKKQHKCRLQLFFYNIKILCSVVRRPDSILFPSIRNGKKMRKQKLQFSQISIRINANDVTFIRSILNILIKGVFYSFSVETEQTLHNRPCEFLGHIQFRMKCAFLLEQTVHCLVHFLFCLQYMMYSEMKISFQTLSCRA